MLNYDLEAVMLV